MRSHVVFLIALLIVGILMTGCTNTPKTATNTNSPIGAGNDTPIAGNNISVIRNETVTGGNETAAWWNDKGIEFAENEQFEEALSAFDRAIQVDPEYALAWYNRGHALRALGRDEEADAAYEKAISLVK